MKIHAIKHYLVVKEIVQGGTSATVNHTGEDKPILFTSRNKIKRKVH